MHLSLGAVVISCTSHTTTSPSSTPPTATTRTMTLNGNLAFGNVSVGSSATSTLTIGNSGTSTLSVSEIAVAAELRSVYSFNWTSGTIAAGASQQVSIHFAPTSAQVYSGTLTVSGDHTSGTNPIPISGTGPVPPPPQSCNYSLSIGST